jgi:hypothetical protein
MCINNTRLQAYNQSAVDALRRLTPAGFRFGHLLDDASRGIVAGQIAMQSSQLDYKELKAPISAGILKKLLGRERESLGNVPWKSSTVTL